MRRFKKKKDDQKKIARQRIDVLFDKAKQVFAEDSSLSNRYVTLARKIAQKYRVRIPSIYKRRFCRHCYAYLVTGSNARTRITRANIVTFCERCRKFSKFGISREKKEQKKAKKGKGSVEAFMS